MPFTLIKGTFHVVGYEPDGDSMKFMPTNPKLWSRLTGRKVKVNAKGHVQLRFEAIDALETHYQGTHQPKDLAFGARAYMLDQAGIRNVVWGPSGARVVSADDGVSGYILSRTVEKNGRPVAFVYTGKAAQADGADVHLDTALLRRSLNFKLAANGYAYATYYKGLFYDLRDTFTAAIKSARKAKKGIWNVDRTASVSVTGLASISEQSVILPKLFRRLVDFLKTKKPLKQFPKYLADRPEDVHVLRTGHFTHLDTLVTVAGKTVKFSELPEDLVFDEAGPKPS